MDYYASYKKKTEKKKVKGGKSLSVKDYSIVPSTKAFCLCNLGRKDLLDVVGISSGIFSL